MNKTINILGYNYIIDSSKSLTDMEGNVGYCDFDHLILRVANDVSVDVRTSTLLHEIIEAVNYHLEVALSENQIKQLEVGLFHSLSRNGVHLDTLWFDPFLIQSTGSN